MHCFRVGENLPQGTQLRGGVGIAENFQAVLLERLPLHGEDRPLRPPIQLQGQGSGAPVRQGGAGLGHGDKVHISAGEHLVLDQKGPAS